MIKLNSTCQSTARIKDEGIEIDHDMGGDIVREIVNMRLALEEKSITDWLIRAGWTPPSDDGAWIGVDDCMPEKGEVVAIAMFNTYQPENGIMIGEGVWKGHSWAGNGHANVTHWCKKPSIPEAYKNERKKS